MNFVEILVIASLITGVLSLLDTFYLAKRRATAEASWLIKESKSLFPLLIFFVLLRAFVVEPYRIPSESMLPSLQVGDFILVNKFTYGLRLPFLKKTLLPVGVPKRGDILVFYHPQKDLVMIKRVVGIPGDYISYQGHTVYLNGKPIPQTFKRQDASPASLPFVSSVLYQVEELPGHPHAVYTVPQSTPKLYPFNNLHVPPGKYFVLGDNRSGSADSRYWGFVEEQHIMGRAFCIILSLDFRKYTIRWPRIFKSIDTLSKDGIQ